MRLCVPETAFVRNCRPNTKGSDTLVGRLIKESWDVSGVYLFIYLSFNSLILIYFILFDSFFIRMSLECKDVED